MIVLMNKRTNNDWNIKRWIIEDSELLSERSSIVGAGRKKFHVQIRSKIPPPLCFAQIRFEIWNWFCLLLFQWFRLLQSLFCFLCGNKTICFCGLYQVPLSRDTLCKKTFLLVLFPMWKQNKSILWPLSNVFISDTLYKKVFPCGLTSWDSAVRFFSWGLCRRFNCEEV